MSLNPSSMRAFLATARKTLANGLSKNQQLNLVIGNESADLDSITSSLIYAYLRSISQHPHESVYIPLLNLRRNDIRIRPELIAILPHANVEESQLITLDDLPSFDSLAEKLPAASTRWVLVDHNQLQGKLGQIYSSAVVGCVDHHIDENKVPQVPEDARDPRLITKAGSCTSLVANHFQSSWNFLSGGASSSLASAQNDAAPGTDDEAVRKTWDAQIAKLALASVLIDTSNLKSKDKVTEHDSTAVKYLESKIFAAPGNASFDSNAFFDEIDTAKRNLDGLSITDLLRKDYKQWDENGLKLGVASIVKPLSFVQSRDKETHFMATLDKFAEDHDLSLLGIMTAAVVEGKFQRELLLRSTDRQSTSVARDFADACATELKLQSLTIDGISDDDRTQIFTHDTGKSRKQVAPLLRQAMRRSKTLQQL